MLRNGEQKFPYRALLDIGSQFMQQLFGINVITHVSLRIEHILSKASYTAAVWSSHLPTVSEHVSRYITIACWIQWNRVLPLVTDFYLNH